MRCTHWKNAGGSVDLYFGPSAPKGFEKNWIPTVAAKAWFTYFRLYTPPEAYFDQSWPLPDIELVKSRKKCRVTRVEGQNDERRGRGPWH